jgi:hypothetical protein
MKDKNKKESKDKNEENLPALKTSAFFDRVAAILDRARSNVVQAVNSEMIIAYWLIGQEIVQEIQAGDERAAYGKKILADLSEKLRKRYGKGFSVTNLRYFRLFYQTYDDRSPKIRHKVCDESHQMGTEPAKHHKPCDVLDDMRFWGRTELNAHQSEDWSKNRAVFWP